MFAEKNLLAAVCGFSMIAATPAMSDGQSTKILEEYFDVLKSAPIVLEVGDKDDASKYTQWNNITLKSSDGKTQVAVPWIKVSKKLLGGFEMTFAEQINGVFQSPDPEVMEPVKFVIESKGNSVDIGGKEGARKYDSSFDEMIFRTIDSNLISVSAKMTDGRGTQVLETGDMGRSAGSFEIKNLVIDYSFALEGESMTSSATVQSFTGNFDIPIYDDFDPENPTGFFDASRNMVFEYSVDSGSSKSAANSAVGPIVLNAAFGAGAGTFGIKDEVATVEGTTQDLTYEMTATGMGFPPMQFNMSEAVVKITVPLDNVDESKPAGYKIALSGLKLSDPLWNMFDPKALLPRDDIDLDIDLLASMRWLKKISDIDMKNTNQAPPVAVDSAEIKAFNLKVAGADLQTSGSVLVDNSQFPPVPDGTVNISLKGGYGLLGKLTELGLVPAQNAAMIQGMVAMFFTPGDGEDHLVSVITMTKDGHISANGMPLK